MPTNSVKLLCEQVSFKEFSGIMDADGLTNYTLCLVRDTYIILPSYSLSLLSSFSLG
jgi:hypothetical protein